MKKLIAVILCTMLMVSMLACNGSTAETTTAETTAAETTAKAEETTAAETTEEAAETEAETEEETSDDTETTAEAGADNTLDLMGMYTLTDPEDVEYDQRTVLYMPVLESDDHYKDGARELFCVLYGLEGKGVYMYTVELFDTEENAAAYADAEENGASDGTAYIVESNAAFFTAMEAYIPDLDTWINNMEASGMMELD